MEQFAVTMKKTSQNTTVIAQATLVESIVKVGDRMVKQNTWKVYVIKHLSIWRLSLYMVEKRAVHAT